LLPSSAGQGTRPAAAAAARMQVLGLLGVAATDSSTWQPTLAALVPKGGCHVACGP